MRLRFFPSGDDEVAFAAARDALLDEFGRWLATSDEERAEAVGDAGIFLDWRYNYSTGLLDEYADADIEEFLLGWCPRKLSVPAEEAEGLCRAVGAYLKFMADTGRLVGDAGRAAAMIALVDDLIMPMREAMENPANFGMAKALFAGLGDISDMSDEQMLAALQAQVDSHNSLPVDERRAATDRFFAGHVAAPRPGDRASPRFSGAAPVYGRCRSAVPGLRRPRASGISAVWRCGDDPAREKGQSAFGSGGALESVAQTL